MESSPDQAKIERRVLESAAQIASTPKPKSATPIANLLSQERSKPRLRSVDQRCRRFDAKHVSGRRNPSAPFSVFARCGWITLVERDGHEEFARTGQVVRRGKAKVRRDGGVHYELEGGPKWRAVQRLDGVARDGPAAREYCVGHVLSPGPLGLTIVVDETHDLRASNRYTGVSRTGRTHMVLRLHPRELVLANDIEHGLPIPRAVVDDDDLELVGDRLVRQRRQASLERARPVTGRNDDRDQCVTA
jgi:hypothetical protein